MSKKLIAKLQKDRDEYIQTADALAARMESGEEITETEAKTLSECRSEAAALNVRIGELQEQVTARLQADMRDTEFTALLQQAESASAGRFRTNDRPTLGQAFTASQAFTDYATRGGGGTSGDFRAQFALISSVDTNSAPVAGVARAADAAMPQRRTPLLEACGYEEVTSTSFEWVEWPVTAPEAGIVPEGQPMGEATYAPVVRQGTLDKAAHSIPITEEFLQDNARMESIVSGAMSDGVRMKAESQAAAALVAATLPTATHESLMKAIRRGVADVQNAGFMPTTVVLNPLDYAEIDIELLALTMQGARRNSPVWGLTVVPAGAVAAGTAYVGDFQIGAVVYARSEVAVKITDSHDSEFISDILRLKAVQRVSTKIVRPEAIVECTVTVP